MRQFNFSSYQRSSTLRPVYSRPLNKVPRKRTWHRQFRYFYYRLLRIQGSPETIARGLAVGVFAGCFPWFGLQTLIAIALAFAVRGNKVVAAAATWISNPFTYVPIFAFNYQVGRFVLRTNGETLEMSDLTTLEGIKELGSDIASPLFFGSLVTGLIAGTIAYIAGRWLVGRARRRSRRRYIRRRILY
jgi:uncharacterized protein (DUF2062 family)